MAKKEDDEVEDEDSEDDDDFDEDMDDEDWDEDMDSEDWRLPLSVSFIFFNFTFPAHVKWKHQHCDCNDSR